MNVEQVDEGSVSMDPEGGLSRDPERVLSSPVERGASAPFCLHIHSKKAFFLGRPPNTEDELLDASQSCWCRRTMQALGPDGDVVDPADCRAGRGCYESVL